MAKKTKKNIKVRDLKPTKDAKGGFGQKLDSPKLNNPHMNSPHINNPHINNPHLT